MSCTNITRSPVMLTLSNSKAKSSASKFLSGLNSTLQSVKVHILANDGTIPSLSNVYARVLRVTTESSSSSESTRDNSSHINSIGPQGTFHGRGTFSPNTRGRGGRGFYFNGN